MWGWHSLTFSFRWFFLWFYLSSVWYYANINRWKSDYIKTWNSIKNDCGRFVKNQIQWPLYLKQKISRNGLGIFHNGANDRERSLLLEQHLMPDYPHPAHPPPHKHTRARANKMDTVCLMTSDYPTSSPHNLFPIPITTNVQVFFITQLSNNKRKFISKVLKVHINRIQLYLNSASPRKQCKLKP